MGNDAHALPRIDENLDCWNGAVLFFALDLKLAMTSLNYLGHVVLKDGRGAYPKKMKAIVNWPVPVTGTGIRTFLGLPNYYKRLTSKYVNIARPLNVLIAGENAS